MTRRENLERLLGTSGTWDYVPAAFFMHFGQEYAHGQAAVSRHLEYFRATGMDFVKVQYEKPFPSSPALLHPSDWSSIRVPPPGFYEEPLKVLEGLIREAKSEALVIQTIYSPYMSAGHATSDAQVQTHLNAEPDEVNKGLERITESMLGFVKECIRLGVDGFYMATQGGEADRFDRPDTFTTYVEPWDRVLMSEAEDHCAFNILHVCDYHKPYATLAPFHSYPGTVVNVPHQMADGTTPRASDHYRDFGRPVMGGLDRKGTLASGHSRRLHTEVARVLADRPPRFILSADCTVSGQTSWETIRSVVEMAHGIGAK